MIAIGLEAVILAASILVGCVANGYTANAPTTIALKPYRVLVVIDVDWQGDPSSYVDCTMWAFHDIVTLLKLWGIPFDVLRLDLNTLNTSLFLDGSGKAKYGVIIWNCNPGIFPRGSQDWSVLATVVKTHGISLISLANTFRDSTLEDLLGINYVSSEWSRMTDPFNITIDHFITRGYQGVVIPAGDAGQEGTVGGYGCKIGFDTSKSTVLAMQGAWPQLAVRDLSVSTKTVWIGGNRDEEFHLSSIMAKILRNAIVYCVGYGIYKTYPSTVMLRIDDMGTSQAAYLSSWHYAQLTREQINSFLIQPLLRHNATLGVMYTTGYPRHLERAVLESWTVDWIDPYGIPQNLTSNYLGILDGISQGVLEVQSHGWTHMQPDLDSSPGPWWDNPNGTEWSNDAWYREFYDERRKQEIDIANQKEHFNSSIQDTEEAFGTFPLSFAPSGGQISGLPSSYDVPDSFTYKLAALMGFGLATNVDGYHYLGPSGDMVVYRMKMTRTFALDLVGGIRARLNDRWDIPVMATFHDKDIALDPDYLTSRLEPLEVPSTATESAVQDYVSQNEFIAYLHAGTGASSSSLGFNFEYDNHYCEYFADHDSSWTLHLSDDMLSQFRNLGRVCIITDGSQAVPVNASTYFNETQNLTVPQGIGAHTIQFVQSHEIPTKISISTSPSSGQVGFKVDINGSLTDINETSIPDAVVVLSHSFSGISEWIPLSSATTSPEGKYHFIWIPPLTGSFSLKAEWAGNATHSGASQTTSLNALPYEGEYVFSVVSNSTISALEFNSTSSQLAFVASGSSGTTGFAQVTIAKTLVANISELTVCFDGNPATPQISSTDDSWTVYLVYAHSTHRIAIFLGQLAEPTTAEPVTIPVALLLAFALMLLATSVRTRNRLTHTSKG